MSNLTLRILTAGVGIPILVWLLFLAPAHSFFALVVFAIFAAAGEAHAMGAPEDRLGRVATMVAAGGIGSALYFSTGVLPVASALAAAVVLILVVHLVRVGAMETVGRRIAVSLGSALYVGVLLTFVGLLHRAPFGARWVLLALTITWVGDTGAYAAGRIFGRHKMYELVSPKKTWEGAVGGLLAGAAAALVAHAWYLPELSVLDALLIALPASALGMIGDLCESLLKRSFGVKDSGKILPGHGGMLDRVDALMFVAPYIYLYAAWNR
jgi:phosphatidate cytidylyltransferase